MRVPRCGGCGSSAARGSKCAGRKTCPRAPAIIASKHQSAWDTFGLIPLTRDPAMIMKQELLSLPLYGWFSRKFEMIPVRRDLGPTALRQMAREAAKRAAQGRDIVIFPEGTRRPPGAPPAYKPGIVLLYEALGIPCVPVALNSGYFWPRHSIMRRPGTIVVEFLPAIPPGLPRARVHGAAAGPYRNRHARAFSTGDRGRRRRQKSQSPKQKTSLKLAFSRRDHHI